MKERDIEEPDVWIGLLGLGTVGSGVVRALATHGEYIRERTGRRVSIRRAAVRDVHKPRKVSVEGLDLTTDIASVLDDPQIGIVVEAMGGMDPAFESIRSALRGGKHVVTANKELLAKRGAELSEIARACGRRLMAEASVGGGIPIVRTLSSYLRMNRLHAVRGILNGTSNYILGKMGEGDTFLEALREAQDHGFAESDPANDIDGTDAAYKLSILSDLAFPSRSSPQRVERDGIRGLLPDDLKVARALGGVVKLIAEAVWEDEGPRLRVGPRVVADFDALAQVDGVLNAVTLRGDVVGDLTFVGAGAGQLPTASAILEDVMEVLENPDPPQVRPRGTAGGEKRPEDAPGTYLLRVFSGSPPEKEESLRLAAARRLAVQAGGRLRRVRDVLDGTPEVIFLVATGMDETAARACVEAFGPGPAVCLPCEIPSDRLPDRLLEDVAAEPVEV